MNSREKNANKAASKQINQPYIFAWDYVSQELSAVIESYLTLIDPRLNVTIDLCNALLKVNFLCIDLSS